MTGKETEVEWCDRNRKWYARDGWSGISRVCHRFASHHGVTVTGHAVSGMVLGFCTLT